MLGVFKSKALTSLEPSLPDASYITMLVQRRQEHVTRMVKWESPLVSRARYEIHLKTSQKHVERMRQQGAPEVSLAWLPPATCQEQVLQLQDDYSDVEDDWLSISDPDEAAHGLDPEECLIGDLLTDVWDEEQDIGSRLPGMLPTTSPLPHWDSPDADEVSHTSVTPVKQPGNTASVNHWPFFERCL